MEYSVQPLAYSVQPLGYSMQPLAHSVVPLALSGVALELILVGSSQTEKLRREKSQQEKSFY